MDQKHKSTSDQKHNITHNWLTVEKATHQLSLGNEDEKSGWVVYEHYVQMNVSNDKYMWVVISWARLHVMHP